MVSKQLSCQAGCARASVLLLTPEGMSRATWGAGLATHGCVSPAHLVSPARVSASSSTESSAESTKLPLCLGGRKAQGCGDSVVTVCWAWSHNSLLPPGC